MPSTITEPKKATHITLSVDVLREVNALDINISQACDEFLRDLVRREQERRWQEENAEFVATWNRTVETKVCRLTSGEASEMARFDLYRNSGPQAGEGPCLADVLSDRLQRLERRVVVPLRRRDRFPAIEIPDRLRPPVRTRGGYLSAGITCGAL